MALACVILASSYAYRLYSVHDWKSGEKWRGRFYGILSSLAVGKVLSCFMPRASSVTWHMSTSYNFTEAKEIQYEVDCKSLTWTDSFYKGEGSVGNGIISNSWKSNRWKWYHI